MDTPRWLNPGDWDQTGLPYVGTVNSIFNSPTSSQNRSNLSRWTGYACVQRRLAAAVYNLLGGILYLRLIFMNNTSMQTICIVKSVDDNTIISVTLLKLICKLIVVSLVDNDIDAITIAIVTATAVSELSIHSCVNCCTYLPQCTAVSIKDKSFSGEALLTHCCKSAWHAVQRIETESININLQYKLHLFSVILLND